MLRARSAYPFPETVERLKRDVGAKGIMMFSEIDQAKLAADADIGLRPSILTFCRRPTVCGFSGFAPPR